MSRSLLLRGGRMLGVPRADALVLEAGRIVAMGGGDELGRDHPSARRIDLDGALVLPGLTDTHTHLYEWSRRLSGVDLSGARDLSEVEAILKQAAAEAPAEPEWIGGSGWDPHRYGQPDALDRRMLDRVFPDRPVVLEARDFHTLWCNSVALERAGILGADSIEVPAGGKVGRFADGTPDGLIYEKAWELIWRARPVESAAVAERWIQKATRRAHAFGLTSVHCMEPMSTHTHYRRLADRGELGLRICFHSPLDDLEARIARGEAGYASDDPWLRMGGVKVFMDGSLGSRSACMHHPYPDGGHGMLLHSEEELDEILGRATAAGIPGTVHAIGDRTVEIVARAFSRAREREGRNGLLHRMEHAQCVPPTALAELARADVYCAMQPVHLADDVELLDEEWGEASRWAYPHRSLIEAGVTVGFGSDAPVATPDPRPGIYSALTRRAGAKPEGRVHHSEQRLDTHTVLRAYTEDAARGGRREEEWGRLRVGARADLSVFDDVLDQSAEAWLDTQARLTVVDGQVVFENLAGGRRG